MGLLLLVRLRGAGELIDVPPCAVPSSDRVLTPGPDTSRRALRSCRMSSTSAVPTNHQVRLAARPSGLPRATDWELTSEPVPQPGPGQLTVQVSHLSIDPAMRGWMN